jgi:hypothetical protein
MHCSKLTISENTLAFILLNLSKDQLFKNVFNVTVQRERRRRYFTIIYNMYHRLKVFKEKAEKIYSRGRNGLRSETSSHAGGYLVTRVPLDRISCRQISENKYRMNRCQHIYASKAYWQ